LQANSNRAGRRLVLKVAAMPHNCAAGRPTFARRRPATNLTCTKSVMAPSKSNPSHQLAVAAVTAIKRNRISGKQSSH